MRTVKPQQEGDMLKWIVIIGLSILAACRTPTMGSVLAEKEHGGGGAHVYPVDSEEAWNIALHVFRWEGAAAIEEHRDGSFMLTTIYNQSAWSAVGPVSYVGAWIESTPSGAKVACVVDGQSFTEKRFHERFSQALALLRRGDLPFEPPPAPHEELSRCASSSECEVGVCLEGRCRR
jgi:hypothetical protein